MSIPRLFYSWLRALVRELSDEAGYERHLRRTGAAPSAREWKRFTESQYRRKYQNARCC